MLLFEYKYLFAGNWLHIQVTWILVEIIFNVLVTYIDQSDAVYKPQIECM